jgi:hypothetical protein
MKLGWTLTLAACLAGCGTAPRATAVAPDAQLAHADGLLSGYAGQVHSKDGVLTLRLVHQGFLVKPMAFDQVFVQLPGSEAGTPVYLGMDHTLYVGFGSPLNYYAVGSYAGTPGLGQPLRYQLAPNARLDFRKDTTALKLSPLPKSVGPDPDLARG